MTTHGSSAGVSPVRRWAILATLLLGTILAILDSKMLDLSVVPLMQAFQTDLRTVRWVLTSYNLVLAMFMISFGSLGDTLGRRRLYLLGQMVFVGGSALVAVARTPWQLIAFRAVQGLGAAALAPNALAIIRESFPEGERGMILGLWAAAVGLGQALGPVVGGLVAQAWGWRVLFLLNLPLGLLVVAAAYRLLIPDPPWRGQRFDTGGCFTLSGALLALAIALTGTPPLDSGWGRSGAVVLAGVLGAGFVRIERRAPVPLVDFRIMLQLGLIATNTVVLLAVLVMTGMMFLSVLYAQLLTDAALANLGLLLAPCALATSLLALLAGWLTKKVGLRTLVVTGLLTLTAAVVLPLLWHPGATATVVFWVNLLAGSGLGLVLPPLLRAVTESVGQHRAGMGAGIYKTVNALGGVFGVVLLGTFLETRIVANALRQVPSHFLPQELSLKVLPSLRVLENHAVQKGLAPQDLAGFHQALVEAIQQGFAQVFGLTALLAAVGVVAGFLVPQQFGTWPSNDTAAPIPAPQHARTGGERPGGKTPHTPGGQSSPPVADR